MSPQAKLVLQPFYFFFTFHVKILLKVNCSKYVHKPHPKHIYKWHFFFSCQRHDVKETQIFLFQPQIARNERCPNL